MFFHCASVFRNTRISKNDKGGGSHSEKFSFYADESPQRVSKSNFSYKKYSLIDNEADLSPKIISKFLKLIDFS